MPRGWKQGGKSTLSDRAPTATAKLAKDYEHHWHSDGSATGEAPKWARYRADMLGEFPSPFRDGSDRPATEIGKFVRKIDQLRPGKGGPGFLGDRPSSRSP